MKLKITHLVNVAFFLTPMYTLPPFFASSEDLTLAETQSLGSHAMGEIFISADSNEISWWPFILVYVISASQESHHGLSPGVNFKRKQMERTIWRQSVCLRLLIDKCLVSKICSGFSKTEQNTWLAADLYQRRCYCIRYLHALHGSWAKNSSPSWFINPVPKKSWYIHLNVRFFETSCV